ncbi:MAG: cell division protein ZapA [Rhodoblastus sp.]|nr:cell division protein ZapA [Rhodoblastus sp.]
MAQVVVTIAGRTYRMNCEDGQESHIEALAEHVDSKMAGLRTSFGEIGEQRLVVMAAITISDELAEAKGRIDSLEEQIAALAEVSQDARQMREARETHLAEALAGVAERLEKLAREMAGKE